MRRTAFVPAVLVLAAPVLSPAQTPDPLARLDSVFRPYARADAPGCAVGVSQKGQPLLEKGYGVADLEHDVPITARTVFEAGSVSKQFTAGAVVLLALDGKLSLDDDVRKYLPELPQYEKPITIRHLLNHTSGLRDWGSVVSLGGWPRTTRVYTNDLVLDVARHQKSLNYTPGEYYSYTNTGYNLLALIVGRVSGKPLAEFTRERIFEPLGMTQTSWRDDFTRVVKGRAVAYTRPRAGGGFAMDMPFENAHGNGGLLTTPADLLKWTANLETGALGGPKFLEEMHRQARLNGGRTIEYASGLSVTRYRGVPEVQHSGATAGYRAFLTRFPAQGLAVAVLCNDGAANATALAHRTAELFLGDAVQPAAAPVRATATSSGSAAVDALAGVYRNTRDGAPLRLTAQNGVLRVGAAALAPVDDRRFTLGTSTVQFDPAPGGRAALRVLTADGDTVRYEPTAPFAPTAAQLADYAGTYVSDEAEATIVVTVDGTGLRLADRYGRVQGSVPPLYADAFGDAGGSIRFLRDGKGKITGLSVRESRAWDVRFTRKP